MSYERLRFKCRKGCDEKFLTAEARNGHEQVHFRDALQEASPQEGSP